MKITRFAVSVWIAVLFCAACGRTQVPAGHDTDKDNGSEEVILAKNETALKSRRDFAPDGENGNFAAQMDEIAEMERSGGFVPGLGLAESGLRERSGDYAGAVLSVYKELSWAYSRGEGGLTRETLLESLARVENLGEGPGAKEAALAARAFFEGRWEEAESRLKKTFAEGALDDYSNWMLMVCALERGGASREVRETYSAIRARYAVFPEYWYRGARCLPEQASRVYAERCVNLAAAGPYAGECRRIFAEAAGLNGKDGAALKTRVEVEEITGAALQENRPELLAELLPMLALPDNPYTLYVSGALRALSSAGPFRRWFSSEAAKAKGRLAERLLYIVRG